MKKKEFSIIQITKVFIVVGFISALSITGCNKDDDNEPSITEIDKVGILPENASLSVGEQEDFSAYALTKSGDTIHFEDLDVDSRWWSSDTTVFTVQENGIATGKNKGDAYCIIEATITLEASQLKALRFFTGRDSAFVSIF